MPPTSTHRTGSASTSSTPQDEIILSRPRGIYTGEYHSKRSRSRGSNSDSSSNRSTTAGGYISENHRQSLSRAVKAILESEKADTKAKAPRALSLQDWIPISSSLDYHSSSMEGLCMEFAYLAIELQKGWDE